MGECFSFVFSLSFLFLFLEGGEGGWGLAKVSGILRHRGVQLILASSWARPAILLVGKAEGECFISSVPSLSFLFLFLLCPALSPPVLHVYLFYLFPFSGKRHKMTHKGWRVDKPKSNPLSSPSISFISFLWETAQTDSQGLTFR